MTRIVSFCFDDGFRQTAERVQAKFAVRGLRATFCLLAAPDLARDPFIQAAPLGDWGFWREAAAAGHEIGPHGYAHEHLGRMCLDKAKDDVRRTLDAFTRELAQFRPEHAVFHLPYLAASPEVIEWLGERMLGVRGARDGSGLNHLDALKRGGMVNCRTFGPDGVDDMLLERVDRFLTEEEGWLVLVLHGLDGEGWGTLSSPALGLALNRLLSAGVVIRPVAEVLSAAVAANQT